MIGPSLCSSFVLTHLTHLSFHPSSSRRLIEQWRRRKTGAPPIRAPSILHPQTHLAFEQQPSAFSPHTRMRIAVSYGLQRAATAFKNFFLKGVATLPLSLPPSFPPRVRLSVTLAFKCVNHSPREAQRRRRRRRVSDWRWRRRRRRSDDAPAPPSFRGEDEGEGGC